MTANNRQLLHRQRYSAVLALSVAAGISICLELLGWRILTPEFSLSQALNSAFVIGVLRNVAGAAAFGILPILPGVILRRCRRWTIAHAVTLWSIGAGVFLLVMAALVAWAP